LESLSERRGRARRAKKFRDIESWRNRRIVPLYKCGGKFRYPHYVSGENLKKRKKKKKKTS